MNTSEYIAKYLANRGIRHVFGIIGSAMYTLFTALGETEGIDYICPLHEQAAGFCADGYSRITNNVGIAIGTVGPGASNLITACAGSYLDSIPVIFLVGVNSTTSNKGKIPIRSYLFQEIDTEALFEPITKRVITVYNPDSIRECLDNAFSIATSERKGPVAILLPENTMYAETKAVLDGIGIYSKDDAVHQFDNNEEIKNCCKLLQDAKKPLFLLGAGIHLSNCEQTAVKLIEKIGCPVAFSYPARDLLPLSHELNVGSIGIFGSRSGNYALQSADVIICVGTRLDPYIIGNPKQFAPNAKIIVVDIDQEEINKYKVKGPIVYKTINCDAKYFFSELYKDSFPSLLGKCEWIEKIKNWKDKYPLVFPEYKSEPEINPYYFIDRLSMLLDSNDIIVTDTGLSAVWVGQSFSFKKGQRWISQFAFSSMGYALPAALGAFFASNRRVICITGDGGLQMNIQEFASIAYHSPNIKIFAICNDGYGLIQKTQDDFNKGHYATDREHHVPIPDSGAIAAAYGIKTNDVHCNKDIDDVINQVLQTDDPCFCSVHIPIGKRISIRVKSGNLTNMYPFLNEQEIKQDLDC